MGMNRTVTPDRTIPLPTFSERNYPMIYEGDEVTAVVVDIDSFRKIEIILDNLANRAGEPEDAIIASASALWQRMIHDAKQDENRTDWLTELYAL